MSDALTTEAVRVQFVEFAHPSWRDDREEAFDNWLTAVRESAFDDGVAYQQTKHMCGDEPVPE